MTSSKLVVGWPATWEIPNVLIKMFSIEYFHDHWGRSEDRLIQLILFVRYWNWVFSIAFKILQSAEDAEEAAQRAFLMAYRFPYDSTRGHLTFASYLAKLSQQSAFVILNEQKRFKRDCTKTITFHDSLTKNLSEPPSNPEQNILALDLLKHIKQVTKQSLSGKMREVFDLHLNGFTNNEITKLYGKTQTQSATTSLLSLAYMRVKTILKQRDLI